MQQRLALAQTLMGAPRVLILDEPANGLDPGEVRSLRRYLAGLAGGGAAILVPATCSRRSSSSLATPS